MLPLFPSTPMLQRRRGQFPRQLNSNNKKPQTSRIPLAVGVVIFIFMTVNVWASHQFVQKPSSFSSTSTHETTSLRENKSPEAEAPVAVSKNADQCEFRRYPEHRYYKLGDRSPDFLRDSDYIYGEWPISLPIAEPQKLCIDQSEWLGEKKTDELPFADGTNPSILSVKRWRGEGEAEHSSMPANIPSSVHYVATACMTESQCQWKDTPEQQRDFHLTSQTEPATVRTVLLLLDAHHNVLAQSTLFLSHDSAWGRRVKKAKLDKQGKPTQGIYPFDDARLFVHQGDLWVSYRQGKGFGYDTQVLNKIHVELSVSNDNGRIQSMASILKASETSSVCCGRNMALMESHEDPTMLQALTWVDPVTVEPVDTTSLLSQKQKSKRRRRRRLSQVKNNNGTATIRFAGGNDQPRSIFDRHHRQLSEATPKKKKSHIHGTNAFMVYWPSQDVFLGVAHFHRPNDRNPNPYARFGHHYTHAFYTVSAKAPYALVGLSPEWVLPGSPTDNDSNNNKNDPPNDAEIIQFASGLELAESPNGAAGNSIDDEDFLIAYGINDCESGLATVHGRDVAALLRPVPTGKQVVDYMQPLLKQ